MFKPLSVAILLLGSAAAANAAGPCYQPPEVEADQAVRFQAKLMVLSDSCGSTSYTDFENHNGQELASYQHRLIDYFRRSDGKRAESTFDRFITSIANELALAAGQQPIASLCSGAQTFLAQAQSFGKVEFEHYVTEQASEQRANYRVCTK